MNKDNQAISKVPRIDFYILSNDHYRDGEKLACQLADKALQHRHRIYIHTDSAMQAERMDDLLWTFRDISFLPHALNPDSAAPEAPILIGYQSPPPDKRHILINLSATIPEFFICFERVAEIVSPDKDHKRLARDRFRQYRDGGYSLHTHELK